MTPSPNGQTAQDVTPTPKTPLARTLAQESPNDPDLAALLALWDRLPEGGRKLLRQTAEALMGTLLRKHGKGQSVVSKAGCETTVRTPPARLTEIPPYQNTWTR